MKNLFLYMLLSSSMLFAAPDLGGISKAIREGNAIALSDFFDKEIELTISTDEVLAARGMQETLIDVNKAKTRVAKFFETHQPKSFSLVHQGTSKSSFYSIGELSTTNGNFRVYIYYREQAGKAIIQELRFEED